MTGEPDKNGDDNAIDADFEPAPAADYVVSKKPSARSGPGWLPFGFVSLLAIGALGLSAYTFSQTSVDASGFAPASITKRIDDLQSKQQANAEDIETVRQAALESENRMAAEIEALLSGGENGEGLQALVAELEAVSSRLDDAMATAGDASALEALDLRLSALEDIGDAQAVSPGQATTIVASLRKRIEAMETANTDLTQTLAETTQALEVMTARIDEVELALESSSGEASSAEAFVLADLQAELENLKSTVERTEDFETENRARFNEVLAGLEMVGEAEQKAGKAQETAAAALALSRIEAAAREGRSFHAAYKQLSEAMPGNSAVERLEPIASSGAPTLRQLTQRFDGDRDAAIALLDESADDGWGWTRQVFGGGVKIRRASAAGGPRDLLEKADEALEAGDLEAAITALSDLPDAPKSVMKDWLTSARTRLELQNALDDVGVRLIGRDR